MIISDFAFMISLFNTENGGVLTFNDHNTTSLRCSVNIRCYTLVFTRVLRLAIHDF